MFPNSTDITLDNKSNISSGTKSYMFDFENGDFIARDGKLIECDGISAIKVWIEKILRTEKGRYSIYSDTEYGCHLEDFTIGNSYTAEFIEVESAVPLTINVSAKLTLANGADLDTAKEKITESITKYLQKNAFSVGYISYAQIGGCILACDEVADYSNLKLNNDTQNISVSETQVPVLGGLRLIEKMPGYYRKSKVMTQLCKSIENEFERLKSETTLTENQFFVILSDGDIKHHEEDVGLIPDASASIDTRRGRVLSKLRGTGTETQRLYGITIKHMRGGMTNGRDTSERYRSCHIFRCG